MQNFVGSLSLSTENLQSHESLRGRITILLSEVDKNAIALTFNMSILRPVYGVSYYSSLLEVEEKDLTAQVKDVERLSYSGVTEENDLAALVVYYLYLALGYYYDSFSLLGGTKYYEEATNIAGVREDKAGWRSGSGSERNRRVLLEQIFSPDGEYFRKAIYSYHRQGMDKMAANAILGRTSITKSLNALVQVNKLFPRGYILYSFFDAKWREIGHIYSQATPKEKQEILPVLTQIDVAHRRLYDEMINKKK